MSQDGTLYGLRICSDIDLPQIPAWNGAIDHAPDVTIRCGDVPALLPDLVRHTPFQQVDRTGRARFALDQVASFLIEQGRTVTVQTKLPLDAPDLSSKILGPVLGIVLHQRDLVPFHATCIDVNGRAVAFAGASGVGKSTFAAALLACGHRLLADDLTVLIQPDQPPVLAVPGFPQQRLWHDALAALSLRPGRPIRSTIALEKYEYRVEDRFCATPLPLAAFCHLAAADAANPAGLTRRLGLNAVQTLHKNIYRLPLATTLRGPHIMMQRVAALAASFPVYRLARPHGLSHLLDFAATLPDLLNQDGAC